MGMYVQIHTKLPKSLYPRLSHIPDDKAGALNFLLLFLPNLGLAFRLPYFFSVPASPRSIF